MKQISIFILMYMLLYALSVVVYTQEKQTSDSYPTRILLNERFLEFSGTTLKTIKRVKIKIQNRDGLGAASIGFMYRSELEKFKVREAMIRLPDGKIVRLKSSDIQDIPFSSLGNNYFSDRRKVTLTFPQATVGAEIHYTTETIGDMSVYQGDFSDIISLNFSAPIDTFRWSLALNKKSRPKAHFQFVKTDSLIPEVSDDGKYIRYTVERINVLPKQSASYDQFIIASTWNSWNHFIKWWLPLYADKTDLSDSIRLTADRLLADQTNNFGKAKALCEWVRDHIRYVAMEYGTGGLEPRKASYTFIQKYGDCKDKTILALAMLRYAGLKAYPVLVSTQSKVVTEIPAQQFNHVILCVEADTSRIFFDPTNTTFDFGYINPRLTFGPQALIIDNAIQFVTPAPFFAQNEQIVHVGLNTVKNTIYGTMSITVHGESHQLFRSRFDRPFSHMKDMELRILMKASKLLFMDVLDSSDYRIIGDDTSMVTIYFHSKPVQFDYNELRVVNLEFFLNQPDAFNRNQFNKKESFQLPPFKRTTFLEYVPDSGYTIHSVPPRVELENVFGYYRTEYVVRDSVIRIESVEERPHIDFTENDYETEKAAAFREYEAFDGASLNRFIVLKKE